ncbi:MAG: SpoIIE family protein phosphatase [Lachnospira sp.]
METKKKEYKRPLSRKILTGCAVFSVFLCFILGTVGAVMYCRGVVEQYQTYMNGILEYTVEQIDGDDLEKCIRTGEKSIAFENMQKVLDQIKETHEIEFIYIVKPLNTEDRDNMMNVCAGATAYEKEYEKDTLVSLGESTQDAYSSDVAANYLEIMNCDSDEITYFSNKTEFGYDYTGLVPVLNSADEPVAVLAVDISMNEIGGVLIRYIIFILICMIVLLGVFLAGLYKWFGKSIVQPISKIQMSAQKFVESSHGQEDPEKIFFENPEIRSEDEMQALSESLITMASDLKTYMKNLMLETKEKERIGTELSLATQIQADMLPSIFPAFPDRKEFDIFATMTPAKEVGGDFYDFFLVDEDHLAMVMADVSGKGVPAALFMVIAKTLIKNRAQMGGTPAEILTDVNNQLCEGGEPELFVTVWLGILEISTGKGMAANAGHEHPVIKRKDGDYELVVYRHSPAVATMGGIRFKEHEFELNVGDTLYVYTDGVPEATNEHNELFGTDRMLEALNNNKELPPDKLLLEVKKSIDAFVGDAPQFDDITMMGLTLRV